MAKVILPICGATLCVAVVGAVSAVAQDSGRTSTFTLGSTVSSTSNPDLDPDGSDTETVAQVDLGYELGFRTLTTDVVFGLSGSLQAGDESGLDSPAASLNITHDAVRHELSFSASAVRSDVTDSSISTDDDVTFEVFDTTGERVINKLSVGVTGGIDLPIGYDLSYSTTDVRYYDTTSTTYSDTDTDVLSVGLSAEISPRIETSLDLSYLDFTSDNVSETHRVTSSASLGADFQLDDITEIALDLGYTQVDTETTTGTDIEDGTTLGVSISREDSLGSYGLDFDRSISVGGAQDTFTLSRALAFPLGELSAQAGFTKVEGGDTNFVGELDFSIEGLRQTLDLSASRRVTFDDDAEETVISQLSGTFYQSLTEVSNLELSLTGRMDEDSASDQLSMDLSVAYAHTLVEDTSLRLGLSADLSREDDGSSVETANSASVFLSLTRVIERRH